LYPAALAVRWPPPHASLIQEGRCHGFALGLGQDLERTADSRTALIAGQLVPDLGRIILEPIQKHAFRVGCNLRSRAPAAQFVHDAPTSDLENPGTEAPALRVKAAGVLPDGQKDILDNLLSGRAIQLSCSQACQNGPIAFVERVERRGLPFGESSDQLLVRNCCASRAFTNTSLGTRDLTGRVTHLDHTLAESEGRSPGDLDGVFDTLMRGTTFGVQPQRTLDGLAVLGRCGQIVVQSDRLDSNRSTYSNNPPINGGGELTAVEGNLAP
jgi:hypothetical protein